jgi:hypothetical protein
MANCAAADIDRPRPSSKAAANGASPAAIAGRRVSAQGGEKRVGGVTFADERSDAVAQRGGARFGTAAHCDDTKLRPDRVNGCGTQTRKVPIQKEHVRGGFHHAPRQGVHRVSLADDNEIALLLEQQAQRGADVRIVVGDQDFQQALACGLAKRTPSGGGLIFYLARWPVASRSSAKRRRRCTATCGDCRCFFVD